MKIIIERRADQPSKFFAYEKDYPAISVDGKSSIDDIFRSLRTIPMKNGSTITANKTECESVVGGNMRGLNE